MVVAWGRYGPEPPPRAESWAKASQSGTGEGRIWKVLQVMLNKMKVTVMSRSGNKNALLQQRNRFLPMVRMQVKGR